MKERKGGRQLNAGQGLRHRGLVESQSISVPLEKLREAERELVRPQAKD